MESQPDRVEGDVAMQVKGTEGHYNPTKLLFALANSVDKAGVYVLGTGAMDRILACVDCQHEWTVREIGGVFSIELAQRGKVETLPELLARWARARS